MPYIIKVFICIFFILFLIPSNVFSAEVLQIKNSSVLEIGDNNRNYEIKIACIHIFPSKEEEAINLLKKELPRKSRINFFPKGSEDGALIANLVSLKTNQDIAKLMSDSGLGEFNCSY